MICGFRERGHLFSRSQRVFCLKDEEGHNRSRTHPPGSAALAQGILSGACGCNGIGGRTCRLGISLHRRLPRIPAHSGSDRHSGTLRRNLLQPGPHFAGARPLQSRPAAGLQLCVTARTRSTRFSIFDFPAPVYRVDPGHAAVAMGSTRWSLAADFSFLRCVDR